MLIKLVLFQFYYVHVHITVYISPQSKGDSNMNALLVYVQAKIKGGFRGGSSPPSKVFYLYVTATINIMKISFNDVYSLPQELHI